MENRFRQRNPSVPSYLRYGMLVRTLPVDNRLRTASLLSYPGYFGPAESAEILKAAGFDAEDARRAVAEARARYQSHLDRSSGNGDGERFDAACDQVSGQSIVVRHNFTCCRTCANDEIDLERSAGEQGYAYFTQQDAASLAYGKAEVYIGFGVFGDADHTSREVGETIVDALVKQGLDARWNGDAGTRIQVVGMDWRRPLADDSDNADPTDPGGAGGAGGREGRPGFGFRF